MHPHPLVPAGSPIRALSATLASVAAAAFLAACSLSLEDPEAEARKKLAKEVEPTWELLEGRWLGDSTFTRFDERATALNGALVLEFYPDSTLRAGDASGLVFAAAFSARAAFADGRIRLPAGAGGTGADTLAVRMRFLGNWLELERASDARSIHLHKAKLFDSAAREALLDSGVWLRRAVRIAHDTLRPDSLRRDFEYLSFAGDSLRRESRSGGLTRVEAGPLAPDGRRFAWRLPDGDRGLHLELFHPDSLRVWTLSGGKADSGCRLYARAPGRHPLDLDMTAYVGHLRTDTVFTAAALDAHFGRYYDLVLGADRSVRTLTNMPDMPRFAAWDVDSGRLWLDGDGGVRTRFEAEKPAPLALVLRASAPPRAFPGPTTLRMTLVDGRDFADNPLERFDKAPYLHLVAGGGPAADTFAYYFRAAYRKQGREGFELARIAGGDTLWAIWRLDGAETFGSGQEGFVFAFQGRNAALGRFTCRGESALDLTLRTLPSANAELAPGLVQGACRIRAAEHPPADSILAITGEFRGRRSPGILVSPLWSQP